MAKSNKPQSGTPAGEGQAAAAPTPDDIAGDQGTPPAAPPSIVEQTRAKLPAAPKPSRDAMKIVGGNTATGPYAPELDQGTPDPDDVQSGNTNNAAGDDGDLSGEETSQSATASRDDVGDDEVGDRRDRTSSGISDELLRQAEAAGMTRARAKKFGTAEALEEALALLEEQRGDVEDRQQDRRDHSAEDQQQDDDGQDGGRQTQASVYKKFEWNRDEYNDATNGLIESLMNHVEPVLESTLKENAELKERLEAGERQAYQREVATVTQQIDDMIQQLPEELKDVYGTLPSDELPQTSKALSARAQLRRLMAATQRSRGEAGLKGLPLDRLFQKAIAELHEDVVEKEIERKVTDRITTEQKTRRGQGLIRPAGRQTNGPAGLGPREKLAAVADREWNRIFKRS